MHLCVPPERAYDALDSDAGRAAFWAESAPETPEGIAFEFPGGIRHTGRVVERIRPSAWAVTYFGGVARFELADDGEGGTDLLLTHDGVDEEEWSEVHAGWLNVLFPMKAWLEHGVDLRNHDSRRTWTQGYADS